MASIPLMHIFLYTCIVTRPNAQAWPYSAGAIIQIEAVISAMLCTNQKTLVSPGLKAAASDTEMNLLGALQVPCFSSSC